METSQRVNSVINTDSADESGRSSALFTFHRCIFVHSCERFPDLEHVDSERTTCVELLCPPQFCCILSGASLLLEVTEAEAPCLT